MGHVIVCPTDCILGRAPRKKENLSNFFLNYGSR